jgi:hypothetical protein
MTCSTALAAGLFYYRPLSTARRTRLTDLEKTASADNNASTVARLAGNSLRACSGPRATALLALRGKIKIKSALTSEYGLVKIDIKPESHIVTATRRVGLCLTTLTTATETA